MRDVPFVRLLSLSDAEYADFAESQVHEFVRQRVNAGEWPEEEGVSRARGEQAELLGGGLRDEGHEFLKAVRADGERVGWIWLSPVPAFLDESARRRKWLSQVTVEEAYRRQGYGQAMMEELHSRLRAQAVEELWLRVYDWNVAARRLYVRLGYQVERRFATDAHMSKRLGATHGEGAEGS